MNEYIEYFEKVFYDFFFQNIRGGVKVVPGDL
jgi:hypothetical protein